MDIQLRKINFIQEILLLNNEKILEKLEKLVKVEKHKYPDVQFNVLSIEELNNMIDCAEDDSKHNRLTSSKDLRRITEKWS